ncbi:ABC transporter substrate-binding protein [Roseibium aquae]|uniref:ABC transporter substrate-binding protein n=1 Tax=Roseibium aquae TaxID=1323746 RepID=A0A916THB9_9HYPH|nr:extracellular solute-binding protein [Roseibium aquae]GGB45230.1 ABC transporter substrate-binding protein [Roseibium aquae]
MAFAHASAKGGLALGSLVLGSLVLGSLVLGGLVLVLQLLPPAAPAFAASTHADAENAVPWTHAIAMHGEPALPADFTALPYANPKAPKGGVLKLGVQGTFDSLNPFIIQGGWTSARGMRERQFGNNIFESLLARSYAEPFTLYGLIAERVRMPDSRDWIEYELNPAARFSDGSRLGVDDVIFSLELMRDKGRPPFRNWYSEISRMDVTGENRLKITFKNGDNRELPLLVSLAPIFSKAHTDRDAFDKSTLTPPVGSGPYMFKEVDPGRRVVYERNPDYWAKDLPIKAGFDNFDEIRIDYFRDETTLQEAFRKGLIDALQFRDPVRWSQGFDFPAAQDGRVTQLAIPLQVPPNVRGIAFNTRRDIFSDVRVRRALSMVFDFEWVNRNLYFGLVKRTAGYWDNSVLSSIGRPAMERELALLADHPDAVLPEVMAGTWRPAEGDGSGRDRGVLRAALALLKEAGFTLDGRRLVDADTGQQMAFEILTKNEDEEKLALAYIRTLELIGISVAARTVDPSQFEDRRTKREFDMVFNTWTASLSPGAEQYGRWSSEAADAPGTFNFVGARNPAIDSLIDALVGSRTDDEFVSAVRALDRVLISGAYAVPLFHIPDDWLGHWTTVVPPQSHSLYGHQFDTWWSKDAPSK